MTLIRIRLITPSKMIFRLKVEAVRLASICMGRISQEQNPQEQNTKKLEDVYAAKIKEYEKEINGLFKRW